MTDTDYEIMSAFSCGVKELYDFFRYEVKECGQLSGGHAEYSRIHKRRKSLVKNA